MQSRCWLANGIDIGLLSLLVHLVYIPTTSSLTYEVVCPWLLLCFFCLFLATFIIFLRVFFGFFLWGIKVYVYFLRQSFLGVLYYFLTLPCFAVKIISLLLFTSTSIRDLKRLAWTRKSPWTFSKPMYGTRPCCLVQAITRHTCPDPHLGSWNCLPHQVHIAPSEPMSSIGQQGSSLGSFPTFPSPLSPL